jgi:hypothetical protein
VAPGIDRRAQGYDTARYTTLGIAVPQIDCFWTGAYFPPGIWMNGQINRHLIAHELGHTYGVAEEGPAWVCTPRCHSEPYGNPFSVMGHGLSDFGAWEKLEFGWIGRDHVVVAERPGSFRLDAIDRPSSDPYALRVIVRVHLDELRRPSTRGCGRRGRASAAGSRSTAPSTSSRQAPGR